MRNISARKRKQLSPKILLIVLTCLLIFILFVVSEVTPNTIPREFYTMSKAFDDGYYPSMERVESFENLLAPIDIIVKVSYISEKNTKQNLVWTVKVESVYYGNIEESSQIDVIIPTIDVASFEQVDKSRHIILGLTNDFYTGLGSVFYLKNGRIYPAYDMEDFIQPLIGITETEFQSYITNIKT